MAMIAITTSSSIRVKPDPFFMPPLLSPSVGVAAACQDTPNAHRLAVRIHSKAQRFLPAPLRYQEKCFVAASVPEARSPLARNLPGRSMLQIAGSCDGAPDGLRCH